MAHGAASITNGRALATPTSPVPKQSYATSAAASERSHRPGARRAGSVRWITSFGSSSAATGSRRSAHGGFLYCLAVAADKFGILLHGVCSMSPHMHLVITDVHGVWARGW